MLSADYWKDKGYSLMEMLEEFMESNGEILKGVDQVENIN